MNKNYYITTAIAYTSGKPHIGNTYEIILADSIARYKRNQGYNVFFQTGTDEHGQKIEEKAKANGLSPKAFVDNIAGEIKTLWDKANVSYDKFIRTTDEHHVKEIYTRGLMKAIIVHLVNLFGLNHNWWMESALIVVGK